MKNIRKGFTLVELIVVTTILAILGSIAFVSLQGYSADARNSKRTSDLNSLQSAISVKTTEGATLMSFVTSTTDADITAINLGGLADASAFYAGGTPNYSALGVKQADFQDPLSNADYRVGATSLKLGQYELAASMEQGSGNRIAKVTGNYLPRTAATKDTSTGSVSTQLGINAGDINTFFVGDIVEDAASNTGKVIAISADGTTLTFNTGGLVPGTIALDIAEEAGLIDGYNASPAGTDGAVTDGGSTLPY